jgi:hypothetical protein
MGPILIWFTSLWSPTSSEGSEGRNYIHTFLCIYHNTLVLCKSWALNVWAGLKTEKYHNINRTSWWTEKGEHVLCFLGLMDNTWAQLSVHFRLLPTAFYWQSHPWSWLPVSPHSTPALGPLATVPVHCSVIVSCSLDLPVYPLSGVVLHCVLTVPTSCDLLKTPGGECVHHVKGGLVRYVWATFSLLRRHLEAAERMQQNICSYVHSIRGYLGECIPLVTKYALLSSSKNHKIDCHE